MRRIFYLTCALIAYGSLYPFHFVSRSSPLGVLALFASSLHVHIDRGEAHDILVNLIVYIPVGFFFVLDERRHQPAWRRCVNATLAGALLSLCMETAQYWVEPRAPSLIDLLTNTISASAGGILGVAFARQARRAFDSLSAGALGHPSSALFLGILWAAALLTPGDWGRTGAIEQIRELLGSPHLGPGHLLVSFSQWLGIGGLASAVIGRKWVPAALFVACLLMPLRFLIPGQHPQLHEFVGVAAAACAWYAPAIQKWFSPRMIAVLLLAGVCVEELRPWHFTSQASSFEWIPLVSMLDSPDWAPTLLVLFRKAAIYGTTVWAVARAGLGTVGGTAVTAVVLSALELAQVFLPGRTPETTDPVLALILGLILLHFDHKFGADPGVASTPSLAAAPAGPEPVQPRQPLPGAAPLPGGRRPDTGGVWTGGRKPRI